MDEMSQAVSEEQHLLQLRQRINAKAENLDKVLTKGMSKETAKKRRWVSVVIWAVAVAILVWGEIESYRGNHCGEYNARLAIIAIVFFIVHFIMSMIMRHFLTRMKNAATPSQQYRAVKRLIKTYQLRTWVPIAVALICIGIVWRGPDFGWSAYYLVICIMIAEVMRVWYFDEDFYHDVNELGRYE